MSNLPDTRDVQSFIQTLFLPDDIVELRSIWPIKGVKSVRQDWCRAEEVWGSHKLTLLAGFNAEGFGIYLGVNPRRTYGGGKDADVLLARALFVDFDGGCTVAAALAKIGAAGLPEPTIVLESGHGVHVYWKLDRPIQDMKLFREHQRGLIQLLGSDPAIHDPPRVMRLPGFMNTKEPAAPTKLVSCVPDRVYAIDRFPMPPEPALPAIAVPTGVSSKYGQRALESELAKVMAAREGERNTTLLKAAFRMGRLMPLGHLQEAPASDALIRAGVAVGLPEAEARDVVARGLANGANCPRDVQPPRGSDLRTKASLAGPAGNGYPGAPEEVLGTVTVPDYSPFPVAALPASLRRYSTQTARGMDADPVLIVAPALSVLAAAIGTSARIVVNGRWIEYACLWTGVVALPGSLKTQTQEAALVPVNEAQRGADIEFGLELQEYKKEKEAFDLAKKAAKPGKVAPSIPEPERPHRTQYVTQDATAEAMVVILSHNPRGVLNAWDELGGFFGGFGRYSAGSNAGESSSAFYKSAYSGRSHTENRKGPDGKGTYVRLECPLVSVTGGVQPEALKRILRRQYIEDGLASRFLWVYPPDRPGGWVDVQDEDDSHARDYAKVYGRLLGIPLGVDPTTGAPRPVRIVLTVEARVVAKEWVTLTQAKVSGATDPAIRAAWAKLKGSAFRIALVLHLVEWAERGVKEFPPVSEDTMRRAVEIAEWFGREGERVYGMLGESDADQQLRELLAWARKRPAGVTARDVSKGIRAYRDNPDLARTMLNKLVEEGFGEWEPGDKGGRPTERFIPSPTVTVTESPDDVEEGGFGDGDTPDPPPQTGQAEPEVRP